MLEKRWKQFWEGQSTPLHGQDTDEFYAAYAKELGLLFDGVQPKRVLEIGCGDGALYEHLGFDKTQTYRGVDLANSMLEAFQKKHPEVSTVCCSGHAYQDDEVYDLIFANGVIQYFDQQMLAELFQHANKMLAPGGLFVCASLLWRRLRFASSRGDLARGQTVRRRHGHARALISYLKNKRNSTLGVWHDFPELERLAQEHQMSATFFGSMHYMYRFHAVFSRNNQ